MDNHELCFKLRTPYSNVVTLKAGLGSCLNFFQKKYLYSLKEVLVFLCPLLHEPTPAWQSK